jgi:DNA repair exonuclease SbcCD ATPase subunit
MTIPTSEQRAEDVRNVNRSAIALLRDSGYATIGATDSAVAYVRRLSEKANEVRSELADLSKLRNPSELSASLRELSNSVEQRFDTLAGRGRELVEALQRNRSSQQAVDRSRVARQQAEGVVASARSAADAGSAAVEHVVEPVDDTAPHFESMTLEELRSLARARGIEGRSEMNKSQLIEALRLP